MSQIDFTDWRVRIGEKGPHVHLVQCLINRWRGQTDEPLALIAEDGIAGAATDLAVFAFQAAHGLESDGTVGKLTWAKLAEYAPRSQQPTPDMPAAMLPAQMTIMAIDTTGGDYAAQVDLFVRAAPIAMRLFCVYWRCNVDVIVGTPEDFDGDKHVALLFGPDAGGVENALGWHWYGDAVELMRALGIMGAGPDDDWDPVGWVDMSQPLWDVTAFHELWEMIVNAMINLMANNRWDQQYYWLLEVCDNVQAYYFTLIVDGQKVRVSDWFGMNFVGNEGETGDYGMASDVIDAAYLETDFALGKYDAMGLVTQQFEILWGGYQIGVSKTNPNEWRNLFAAADRPGSFVEVPTHAARRVKQREIADRRAARKAA